MQNVKLPRRRTSSLRGRQFKIQNFKKLEEELPGIKKNISLKDYTTFKIGGPAKYFFVAKNKKDLIRAIEVAKKFHPVRDYRVNKKAQRKQISNGVELPFFILGGGSNLLVSDKGYNGLVIKFQNPNSPPRRGEARPITLGGKIQINSKFQNPKIYTEAGTRLALVISEATKKSLTGLEWAVGIPGTIGGAVYGNAGAFGKSIADVIKNVEVFDVRELGIRNYELGDCRFGYRNSIFKKNKNLIIFSATFQLRKGDKREIEKKIKKNLEYRKKTQPLNFPSAGSVFQNPKLLKKYPELKEFNKKGQIPAGWLIDKCNLKGKRIGNVKISEKHANFIVNLGDARAEDVKKLIILAKKKVKNKFSINLEEEIQFLGF